MLRSMRVPILIVLAAAACGDASSSGDAMRATTRDSAGVAIVENPTPPDSGGALALAAEPEMTIGVLEGAPEYQLYGVGRAVRLTEGRIVVPNDGASVVRFYGPDGRFITETGGDGEGPGEFRSMAWINGLPGDSLLVYDQEIQRLSLLDHEGAFVRSIPVEGDMQFPFPAAMTDADHVVFAVNEGFQRMHEAEAGVMHDTIAVHVLPWREGLVFAEPLLVVPGSQMFLWRTERFMSVRPLLLGGYTDIFAGPDGIYVSDANVWEIRHYSSDGRLLRIIRRAHEPVAVTAEMWDAEIEQQLENAENDADRARETSMFSDMPRPSTLPAIATTVVDRSGRIWAQRYRTTRGTPTPSTWDVFDPEGSWIAAVTLPPRFYPTEIGEDWLLGVARDEFDVEQVRLYRIHSTDEAE